MDSKGRAVDMVARSFPVANEFHSGLYEIDHKTVFVPLASLQDMLKMNRATKVATGTGVAINEKGEEIFTAPTVIGEDPARVTNVLVRGKTQSFESAAADKLADKVGLIYRQFAKDFEGQVPPSTSIRILTWEDQNRTMINAVRKETALVLFIFSFVSMTAVFLVLAIFWAMVSEKTKDIGILRAIGASRTGVAGTWLLYGAAIGLLGAVVGFAIAYGVVTNINAIHEWLGEKLGLYIWDPKVYYFSRIPSSLNATHVTIVLAGGVLASCIGALWPALRAARMSPVRALRFE
jgi:lipoprotein-releasing system permease protein